MFKNGKLVLLFYFFFQYLFLISLPRVSSLNQLLSLPMLLCGTLCLFGKNKTEDLGMALEPWVPFEQWKSPGATAVCSPWKNTSGG